MADKKEKHYIIENAQLMAEWNWEKNKALNINPNALTSGSGKKAWWKCEKGHEWQATITNRSKGSSCPYCSNYYALAGYNDLATLHPELAKEWNYSMNKDLAPSDVLPTSNKKVWWICEKGHEWQSNISNRTLGNECPFCSGRMAIIGVNDLQTINPMLSKEWNYHRNGKLTPSDVLPHSQQKVWWICEKGHEWEAIIGNRSAGKGCPFCSGLFAIPGLTDLQTVNPKLSKEWDYSLNGDLRPSQILPSSNKKVWWICAKGHKWQAAVHHRNAGEGCPVCSSELRTSFPEYALIYYFGKCGINAIHSYKELGYELDVYIPSFKCAIEYDGSYWHKTKTQADLAKNLKCKTDGIKLYRIREGLTSLNSSSIDYIVSESQEDLSRVIREIILDISNVIVDVNVKRDYINIENLREHITKKRSLISVNPILIEEWDFEKNGSLLPEHITPNSNKKVWWKCQKGHSWQATASNRSNGTNCPYCANKRVLVGFNDLKTWCEKNNRMDLTNEFEEENLLSVNDVTATSGKKVWWKCSSCGHKWEARIDQRCGGAGCPICSVDNAIRNRNINYIKKLGSLADHYPEIVVEWNYEKNGDLMPQDVLSGSNQKVWWKCEKGHEWQAIIVARTKRRIGCPICSGKRILPGYNDLATLNPTLLADWDYDRNNLDPNTISPNSYKKVWWKCAKGHSWEAQIKSRNAGCGCPQCAKEKRKKKN